MDKRILILSLTILFLSLQIAAAQPYLEPGGFLEAEAEGIIRVGADAINVPDHLAFWGNGSLTFTLKVGEAGLFKLLIGAKGTAALESETGKKWPLMKLFLDGKEQCLWEVTSKALYVSPALALAAGNYQLTLAFTNDASHGSDDRNLFIDGMALGAIEKEAALPSVFFKGTEPHHYGEFIAGDLLLASRRVTSLYPPKQQIEEYQAKTISATDLKFVLANGKPLQVFQFIEEQSLNGEWKISPLSNSTVPFGTDTDLEKGYWQRDFDDSSWDSIGVPLNWYQKYPEARKADAAFVKGWYRRKFQVAEGQRGKRVFLKFSVIGYEATLFINGVKVGTHHGDFTPWEVEITEWIKLGQENIIAIRVYSDFGAAYTKRADQHTYGSQWGIGDIKAGLWQDVSLCYKAPIHFEKLLITPKVAQNEIEVEYWLTNPEKASFKRALHFYAVVSSAMKKDQNTETANIYLGKVCTGSGTNKGSFIIPLNNPKLWSPEDPYLYYLTLAVAEDGEIITAGSQRFGFREFKIQGPNFYLNNQRTYLFGENLPSVWYGGSGRTEEEETALLVKTLTGFKAQGYNILRTAHMPIIPLALKLADEIGIMIYNEWSWCFSTDLDQKVFEARNLAEFREWIYRDYNYPSVVMWSGGNEINYGGNSFIIDQLNKQVASLRKLDNRPIVSFSGLAHYFGNTAIETDAIDLHLYAGVGAQPWTYWEGHYQPIYEKNVRVYGDNGKLNKPFIIWECVGYSWGDLSDPSFIPGRIEDYAHYAKRPTSWEVPNGIGFAGTIGLAASLDPKRGTKYGKEVYGKRLLEFARYNTEIAGFAPWFQDSELEAATLWNQPVYVGLRGPNRAPFTNLFTGETYTQKLFVINSQGRACTNLELLLTLIDDRGQSRLLRNILLPKLEPWAKIEQDLDFQIPLSQTAGVYQLRLTLREAGREISRNYYDLFVQNTAFKQLKLQNIKQVAVLRPNTALGNQVLAVLADLGVSYTLIDNFEDLSFYQVVVIPPSNQAYVLQRDNLLTWADAGGVVLQLEQNYEGETFLGKTISQPNTFVDLAVPTHPVFAGLEQLAFDTWGERKFGNVLDYALLPFTLNALATRAPLCGDPLTFNAIAEGSWGEGRLFASQVNATELWGINSAATTYLVNLLKYTFHSDRFPAARNWVFQ
jgi:beta-galactosidase